MVVVTHKHIAKASAAYPDAAAELEAWERIVKDVRWASFVELRATIPDADMVDGYVIFNIRRNRYRLVTFVHFSKPELDTEGHVYVRSFLTHREYDNRANWDRRYGR